MKTDLYCIRHGHMVLAEQDLCGRYFHMETVRVNNSPDPGDRYDLAVCEFPEGYAACPPPAFDLEEYIEQAGSPPEIVEKFITNENVLTAVGYISREAWDEHAKRIAEDNNQGEEA